MVRRKGIVDSLKKLVSNVGDDIGVVWGVESNHIIFLLLDRLGLGGWGL